MKSGTSSRKAEKRQSVSESDLLTIPRSALVSILDTDNNRVYSSLSQGTMTVRELINKAKNNASDVTLATNEVALTNIKSNGPQKSGRPGRGGVSIHEANAVIHAPLELPDGVSYLQYLRSLGDKEYNDEFDAILLRRDINYDDQTFNFAVFNTLKEPLYFNIIQQRTDREPELHFQDNPIALPRTQTIVEEYLYLVPEVPDGYIVVASDRDFTLEDVIKLLDPSYVPTTNFYITLLRK